MPYPYFLLRKFPFGLFLLLILITMSSSASAFESKPELLSQASATKRTSWPEWNGKSATEAKAELQQLHPDWVIDVIPCDAMVTMDYREDRVRIFADTDSDLVCRIPRVG